MIGDLSDISAERLPTDLWVELCAAYSESVDNGYDPRLTLAFAAAEWRQEHNEWLAAWGKGRASRYTKRAEKAEIKVGRLARLWMRQHGEAA